MNIIRKFHQIITGYKTESVEGAEVWIVSWYGRYGHYSDDWKRKAKAFLSEDAANTFAESLAAAQELLEYTECIDIRVDKQK